MRADELQKLFFVAPPELIPVLALGAFAGLRSAELIPLFSFSNGEISGDGMWSQSDCDNEGDERQVVNAFDYIHAVFFLKVRSDI